MHNHHHVKKHINAAESCKANLAAAGGQTPSKSDKIIPTQAISSNFRAPMSQSVVKCDDMFCLEESVNSSTET